MNETYRSTLAEMQKLTRQYASYSQSRSGLGNVLGGTVGVVVFFGVWLLGAGAAAATLTVGLTAVWLAGKEIIRRRLYRRFGQAQEIWTNPARRTHKIYVGGLALLLAGFAIAIIAAGFLTKPQGWPYLIFCLVTPLVAWWLLRTVNELVIGFGLLFMCAITASGHMPMLLGLLIVPCYGVALIGLGLAEHRQFQALAAQLAARRGGQA